MVPLAGRDRLRMPIQRRTKPNQPRDSATVGFGARHRASYPKTLGPYTYVTGFAQLGRNRSSGAAGIAFSALPPFFEDVAS